VPFYKKFTFLEALKADTGYYFYHKANSSDTIDQFGIGVSSYFKFLKYMVLFFIIFFILSIPILSISIDGIKNSI
jgi:hypothetical protein